MRFPLHRGLGFSQTPSCPMKWKENNIRWTNLTGEFSYEDIKGNDI